MKESLLKGLNLGAARAALQASPDDLGKPALVALFLSLDAIRPDPNQPRRGMEAESPESQGLEDLAASILRHGVLQPITVEAIGDGKYRIIAGERRWRAARMALESGRPCARKGYDLKRIPAVITKSESPTDRLEMQLVENLARADMRDEDVAAALQTLLDTLQVSKTDLAQRLGRSRQWINLILVKGGTEARALADRIGVPLDQIGMNEMQRMLAWQDDQDKESLLEIVADAARQGRRITRSFLDDLEKRHDIESRYPQLRGRDLPLEDLQFVADNLDSEDPARRSRAQRILHGEPEPVESRSLSQVEISGSEATVPVAEESRTREGGSDRTELRIPAGGTREGMGQPEATLETSGAEKPWVEEEPANDTDSEEDDSLERFACARDIQPNPEGWKSAIVVSIPTVLVEKILERAGVSRDLSATDANAVISALERLLG
ncbi:MAG: ParB/RepB/Spo0J family partition protein [Acidithiobacillus sp.]